MPSISSRFRGRMKLLFLVAWLVLTLIGPLWNILLQRVDLSADYRTANRDSVNIAPDPAVTKDAVIQFYAARAFNWRGIFASHCWLAVKPAGAQQYTVYQIMGWRTWRGLPALSITQDIPDRRWFNATPHLLVDIRGKRAEPLITKIEEAIKNYPYAAPYLLWPGPNSNTFPAYLGRAIPELGLVMPADAIGKDFIPNHTFFSASPSGTGYQFSFYGILGLTLAKREGLEINLLGLVYGVRFAPFAILLPGLE